MAEEITVEKFTPSKAHMQANTAGEFSYAGYTNKWTPYAGEYITVEPATQYGKDLRVYVSVSSLEPRIPLTHLPVAGGQGGE